MTTKIATIIVLDVGQGVSCDQGSDGSFFSQAKECLSKIIVKKLLAGDNDEMSVILFGDDNGNYGNEYNNINVIYDLQIPSIRLFKQVSSLKISSCEVSDWAKASIVALDVMKNQTRGKRFMIKQILIISNFETELHYKPDLYKTLVSCLNSEKVKFIVVGIDDALIKNSPHLKCLQDIMNETDIESVCWELSVLKENNEYYDKKRRGKRYVNVTLDIGSKIKIPVSWVKITSEPHLMKWVSPTTQSSSLFSSKDKQTVGDMKDSTTDAIKDFDDCMSIASSASEKTKVIKYGMTKVPISYGEMDSLKRQSGLPVFQILMFTKRTNLNPAMFIGKDVYAVLPKDGNKKAQEAFVSLVEALIESDKLAIAKRILTRNGPVTIGALIPFSDENGIHMFFLSLPTAEWIQMLPRQRDLAADSLKDNASLIDNIIDGLMLESDLSEEDKGVLVKDPTFQHRCAILEARIDDEKSDPTIDPPDTVMQILSPVVSDPQSAYTAMDSLLALLPHLSTDTREMAKEKKSVNSFKRKSTSPLRSTAPPDQLNQLSATVPQNPELLKSQLSHGDSEEIKKNLFGLD